MSDRPTDQDPGPYHGTPGWVKAFGIIAIVVVLLIGFILITGLGGPHGPQRHGSAGGGSDRAVATMDGATVS